MGDCGVLRRERHIEQGLASELGSSLIKDAVELKVANLAASLADLSGSVGTLATIAKLQASTSSWPRLLRYLCW